MNGKVIDVECDFLVVGGGLAGLYAAVCASSLGSCVVVTKQTLVQSNSYWAQGGIALPLTQGILPSFTKKTLLPREEGFAMPGPYRFWLKREGRESRTL